MVRPSGLITRYRWDPSLQTGVITRERRTRQSYYTQHTLTHLLLQPARAGGRTRVAAGS